MTAQERITVPDTPVVLEFAGELDAADSGWARELEDAITAGGREIVIDLRSVTFADSSVIRELLIAHRRVAADDGWVRIVYTHHVIRRVIDICGLSALLPQYTTVDAALRGAPSQLHPDEHADRGARDE